MYLLWSNKHRKWWRAGESGYADFIEEAGRYTKEEAERIVNKSTVNGLLKNIRKNSVTGREFFSYNTVMVQEVEDINRMINEQIPDNEPDPATRGVN